LGALLYLTRLSSSSFPSAAQLVVVTFVAVAQLSPLFEATSGYVSVDIPRWSSALVQLASAATGV
jgi:hypothetical protein